MNEKIAYSGQTFLKEDKSLLKKQRHTAKRIHERLRDEHGFIGGLTIVTNYVREQKRFDAHQKLIFFRTYITLGVLDYLPGGGSAMPHDNWLPWRPDQVTVHVVADLGIPVTYFSTAANGE